MISVVIPAYNKAGVITETLKGLCSQSLDSREYEVLVVDDGSTDETPAIVGGFTAPYPLRLLCQSNQGASVARNLGAAQAKGECLLFLDGDMVASPQLLAVHQRLHLEHDHAQCVGRVLQFPALDQTPIHRIFARSFDLGEEPKALSYSVGISGNMSMRADHFAHIGGFSPSFPRGEDVELAYRAMQSGLDLLYDPAAVSYHNHVMPFDALCAKIQRDHYLLGPLFREFPQFINEMPYLQDLLPVAWGRDPAGLIAHKAAHSLVAAAPIHSLLQRSCIWLEHHFPASRGLQILVWKVLASYTRRGLRASMHEFGWRQPG